jgi:hypothetical protein
MKTLRPLLFIVSLVLIVGLACSFGADPGANPTTPPQQPPTQPPPTIAPPTEVPPEPTEVPPTEEAPVTEEPAQAQQFFTEEFDNPLSSDWSIFTVTASSDADPDKVTVEAQDSRLVWDFDSEFVYYYLFYSAFDYEDVRVDVHADNRGRNNNNISLICRYDPDVGWYEFNIANNGLYDIYFAEITSNGDIAYNRIVNGGSNAINQGMGVNEYAITCEGDELTLFINGDEVISTPERRYGLRSGQIGISVSSFNVLPILIEMDWVQVSEP